MGPIDRIAEALERIAKALERDTTLKYESRSLQARALRPADAIQARKPMSVNVSRS